MFGDVHELQRALQRNSGSCASDLDDEFVVEVRRARTTVPLKRSLKLVDIAEHLLQDQRDRAAVEQLAQRTYDGYESGLRLHCLPMMGKRAVTSITPDQLVSWHRQQL